MDQGNTSRSSERGAWPHEAGRFPAPEFGALLTPVPSGMAQELHIAIRIDNFAAISQQFGERHAEKVKAVVCDALRALADHSQIGRTVVLPDKDGLISAIFVSENADCHALVHAACVLIAMTPVAVGRSAVVPVLSFGLATSGGDAPSEGRDSALLASAKANLQGEQADVAAQYPIYERDLVSATGLLEAVRKNEVLLRWQPVRDADNPCEILYRHVSLCRLHDQAYPDRVKDEVAAIERVGASPALDCYTVSRTIDELQRSPHVSLAVTISGRSASQSFWWAEVLTRLAADRALGPRLFLIIGDTAPLPKFGDLVRFADQVRRYGCHIGVGQFGAGYSSIRALLALKPDIISIDAQFLARGLFGGADRKVFDHIVGLAGAIGRAVIASGVDSENLARFARDAGVTWQQGYHQGCPSVVRGWTADSGSGQIATLERFRDAFCQSSALHDRGGKS